ncbi:hypothetical protein F5Y10DRAFT_255207 [Nemania abortiva]|nr:hypothetical protein F5Y10DRAFT_255207 [Nemania abortiva]
MDALRKQLADTQGALTDRDRNFRQLKADHKQATNLWSEEKSTLEARIARLEAENEKLTGAIKDAAAPSTPKNAMKWEDLKGADGEDDTVPMSRSKMKKAEMQFNSLVDEVAQKTKLCEALRDELAQSSRVPVIELSDEDIVARWNQLREKIRGLSLEYLSNTFSASLVTDKYKGEFKALSPHWKSYASTPNITCYMFRALVWRYLLRYFEVPFRAWGRDISRKIGELAEPLSKKVSETEYEDWCIRTAALVHKTFPIDKDLVEELTEKIAEATTPLAGDVDPVALTNSIRIIVATTAELSAAFDQSRFVVLMHNEPGSDLTHGFPYRQDFMDMRAKMGSHGVVDMMLTPCLLKKEGGYSVMVKAEVVC